MGDRITRPVFGFESLAPGFFGLLRRNALRVGGGAVCLYLSIAASACFWQDRIVYHPTRTITRTPADAGMPFEDVAFHASDGVLLRGWFVPAEGRARGALLFCHGNAGNMSDPVESLAMYRAMGLDVLAFDYRGYGRSAGSPGEAGTYLDAEAAWRYLTEVRGYSPDQVVVLGRSLGGPIAAHLAAETRPRALVVESTFCSAPELGADFVPWLPVKSIVRFDYSTLRYVRSVSCPVLVIHSPADNLIPYRHGLRLYAGANEPKEFLAISGDHSDGWLTSGRLYTEGLRRFVERHLPASGAACPAGDLSRGGAGDQIRVASPAAEG